MEILRAIAPAGGACVILLGLFLPWCGSGAAPAPDPPELKISGLGVLQNIQTKRSIRAIQGERLKQAYWDADVVEDIALVLLAQLRDEGFLQPSIAVELTLL